MPNLVDALYTPEQQEQLRQHMEASSRRYHEALNAYRSAEQELQNAIADFKRDTEIADRTGITYSPLHRMT